VATVSDIVTVDGALISSAAWSGAATHGTARPDIDWPVQGRPHDNDWTLWQTALRTAFKLSGNRKLLSPLDGWLDADCHYTWFFDTSSERIYKRTDTGWIYYPRIPSRAS